MNSPPGSDSPRLQLWPVNERKTDSPNPSPRGRSIVEERTLPMPPSERPHHANPADRESSQSSDTATAVEDPPTPAALPRRYSQSRHSVYSLFLGHPIYQPRPTCLGLSTARRTRIGIRSSSCCLNPSRRSYIKMIGGLRGIQMNRAGGPAGVSPGRTCEPNKVS